jgi:myo-inositol-1(or 4)-monophosphatase
MDHDGRVPLLREVTREAGAYAAERFRSPLEVETKAGPMDSVTAVDRATQRLLFDRIGESYPGDVLVGEEDGAEDRPPEHGYAWVVDPIDGTNNYVAGNRRWTTSVALVRDGEAVAAVNDCPALGDAYAATPGGGATRGGEPASVTARTDPGRLTVAPLFGLAAPHRRAFTRVAGTVMDEFGDLRNVGSGQAALSMVAAGELDAAVTTVRLPAWDTVAGVHLVRAAGGTATDVDGEPWTVDATGLVATNGRAHDAVVAAFEHRVDGDDADGRRGDDADGRRGDDSDER